MSQTPSYLCIHVIHSQPLRTVSHESSPYRSVLAFYTSPIEAITNLQHIFSPIAETQLPTTLTSTPHELHMPLETNIIPVRISVRQSAILSRNHFYNRNTENITKVWTQVPAPVLSSVPPEHGLLKMALLNVRSLSNKTFIQHHIQK